jgi:alginate O-acetyltransferase complex protein AlgI
MSLGFSLPENFRYPYAATGFSDFWRRWHISLSAWLRDYLYIPLGRNQKGKTRTYINLMLTMLLGGLWHGAAWTFIVWGALHGIYLCVERLLIRRTATADSSVEIPQTIVLTDARPVVRMGGIPLPGFLRSKKFHAVFAALLTFFFINIAWVFFRAEDFNTAGRLLSSLFGVGENGAAVLPTLDIIIVTVITVLLLVTHWFMRNSSLLEKASKAKWWIVGSAWGVMLILLIVSQKSSNSFIYFQF